MDQIVTDEPSNEVKNSNVPPLSDNMDISIAFKEIVSQSPPRYTELVEAVKKTFEEISEIISPKEFKSILGDISFLSKRNVTNLLSILKTQFNNHMSKTFKQIIQEENLCEIFKQKDTLEEEEAKKYLTDNDSMELIGLEEYLHKLNVQISGLEETNEILFTQVQFNKQRYDKLSMKIEKLLNELNINYSQCDQQTDVIRKELTNM